MLRFRVPDGETTFNDFVHGPTVFRNEEIEDFVLLRSDGTPTYHLSVVTDDIAMEISHIIRGDDHLSNTPKQILLYRAFSVEPPTFAHLPLILGEDRKRLSSGTAPSRSPRLPRHRDRPRAMFNFLALLGWSPGGDLEVLTREDLVRLFSFGDQQGRRGLRSAEADWLSGQYIAGQRRSSRAM